MNIRRAISALLATAIFSSSFAAVTVAARSDALVNETFNQYITNDMPSSFEFTGNANSRVVEDGTSNKSLYLACGGNTNSISFPTEGAETNFVVSFDIKTGGSDFAGEMTLENSGGTSFAPITFSGGSIILNDGKKIGSLPEGISTHIDFGYNQSSYRYFVRINGDEKVSQWITGVTFTSPAALTFTTEYSDFTDTYAIIDNVRVYNGTEASEDFPVASFNTEAKEFTEVVYEEEEGLGTVFLNNDFDDPATALNTFGIEAKNNIVEARTESDGNGYMYLGKTQATDPLINVTFSSGCGRYLVLEGDFRIDSPGAENKRIFRMRDTDMAWSESFVIGANGEVILSNNSLVTKLDIGKWKNLAIRYDFRRRTYNFYADGELLAEDVPMTNQNFGTLGSMRITIDASSGNGDLLMDNMKIYESSEPCELPEDEESDDGPVQITSKFPSDEEDINKLRGTVALSKYTDYIFIIDRKETLDARPYVKNDYTLVPVRAISEAFGVEVEWDESTNTVTVDNRAVLTIGSDTMTIDGETVNTGTAPEIQNDRAFLPLRVLAERVLGKTVFYDDMYSLIVISDGEFQYADSEEDIKRLNSYLFFDRPSAAELQEQYAQAETEGVHPRLLATQDDFDRAAELYNSDEYVRDWIDLLIDEANGLLDEAPADYYIPDGLRLLETSRTVLRRILTLGFVYRLTGDRKYSERAWEEMEHVGQYPDWNPGHFLDVGEMTAAFAIGYDWCYEALDEEQRAYIEECIIKFGLNQGFRFYSGGGTGTDFTMAEMNWNVVCNGGLAMGAMAIADTHPDEAFNTISLALRSLEYMMPEFAPDGAWEEGAGYWSYTVQYLCYLMSSLNGTFGHDFHLSEVQGLDTSARFYVYSMLNTGVNNYHDASFNKDMPPYVFYLANLYGDYDVSAAALQFREDNSGGGTISGTALDCLWYEPNDGDRANLALDGYFAKAEASMMRASWEDSQSMAVGFHGGNVTVNHGHIDSGTFVLDMLGTRWAVDLGPEDYNAGDYFGTGRNNYYRVRAEGHNVYVIDPDENAGQETDAFCPIIQTYSKEKGAFQVMDLTDAYRNKVNSATRGFMLCDDRRTFIVQDEIELKQESDLYFFVHTNADINIVDNNTVIFTQNGQQMQIKLDSNVATELSVMDAQPLETSPVPATQSSNTGTRKLTVKIHSDGEVKLSMRFAMLNEYAASQDYTMTDISSWSIPDGEIAEFAEADMIYVNGAEIDGFDPKTKSYKVLLPYDTAEVPEITVDTNAAKTEIVDASSFDGQTEIKLYANAEEPYYNIYTVQFYVIPKQEDVEGWGRYDVANITASAVPEAQNPPENAIDGDLSTRWAGEGEQWIEIDLGTEQQIDAAAVAYMNGAERRYRLEIQVSSDGVNYETVYSGETSGTQDGYEIFEFESRNARYLRLSGSGNTVNNWNSVTELGALYRK